MKIIVTGVNGFLGSHMADYLSAQGHQVIGCARHLREKKPADLHTYVDCDLSKRKETLALFKAHEPIDTLYHFAGEIGSSESHHSASAADINLLINVSTFSAAESIGIPTILFPSSVNVYEGEPSEYAQERLLSEKLAKGLCKKANVHIVRLANVIGYGAKWKGAKARVIPALCRKVLQGNGTVKIRGDGKQLRAFIHVHDVIRAMDIITKHASPRYILDLGIPELFSVNYILSIIEELHGSPIKRIYEPQNTPDTLDLKTHLFTRSTSKIPWYPGIPLQRAIQDTFEWVRESIIKLDKPTAPGKK